MTDRITLIRRYRPSVMRQYWKVQLGPESSPCGGPPRNVTQAMQVLGDPTNMAIIQFLRQRPFQHVAQINEEVKASRSVMARRLLELEQVGVLDVDTEKPVGARRGQLLHYSVNAKKLVQLVEVWSSWMKQSFPDV